jgi:YidC/Oxa1 family membrane protein insertase
MNLKTALILTIISFYLFGAATIIQSASANDANAAAMPQMQAAPVTVFTAVGGAAKTITLGSLDPNTGFKFLLELTSKGAGIAKATLSEFDNLNLKDTKLLLISPATRADGSQAITMANGALVLTETKLELPLDKLDWNALKVKTDDGGQMAVFEAIIKDKATGEEVIKLTKTFRIQTDVYDVDCNLTVENLSTVERKLTIALTGPAGINKEDPRSDTRKVVSAFRDTQGQIVTTTLGVKKLEKAGTLEQRRLTYRNAGFLWAATTNKYFAAIVVATPDGNMNYCNWLDKDGRLGWFANPEDAQSNGFDGNIGIDLKTTIITLAAKGDPQGKKNLNFRLFLGPKDKTMFDKHKLYKDLAFVQTIDFMSCCCPTAIISLFSSFA